MTAYRRGYNEAVTKANKIIADCNADLKSQREEIARLKQEIEQLKQKPYSRVKYVRECR